MKKTTTQTNRSIDKLTLRKETVRPLRDVTNNELLHAEGGSGGHKGQLIHGGRY